MTKKKPLVSDGRKLTISQKAEAVSMWRTGSVTLEDLARKFKKRPETFSRLFKAMGIEKGSGAEEATKRIVERAEERIVNKTAETLRKIEEAKQRHIAWADGIARLTWAEISKVRAAGTALSDVKDNILTLKIASEVMSNSRKEIYTLMEVEKHEKTQEMDDLPELTVRELTPNEVIQLRDQSIEDDDMLGELPDELGEGMMPEDSVEGF